MSRSQLAATLALVTALGACTPESVMQVGGPSRANPSAGGSGATASVPGTAGAPVRIGSAGMLGPAPIINPTVPVTPVGAAGAPGPTMPPSTGPVQPVTMPMTPVMTGGKDPRIPQKPAMCPEIKTGTITVLGQEVQLWVGAKKETKGPIVFYWHGTGSSSAEASGGLGSGNSEIMQMGGVIASFSTTTKMGMNTGNNVWYTGDFEMADQILACAIEQQNIDPRKVYTAGCSAGGLQASAMLYGRSSYLAAAMPNSGGTTFRYTLEDPSHVPALITTHGMMGKDVVGIDFSQTSATQDKDVAAKGGFVVNCDHGGGHCGSPAAVKTAQWQFLKDHPFGVTPEPYASGLPMGFPSVCQIIGK
jgi:predicted esterase